jgi:hypothetical protein
MINNKERKLIKIAESIFDYTSHFVACSRTYFEGGEPTKNGGYREKFQGKWYQAKPKDKTPKCTCGLDQALDSWEKEV